MQAKCKIRFNTVNHNKKLMIVYNLVLKNQEKIDKKVFKALILMIL
jgi:hypothetical protein